MNILLLITLISFLIIAAQLFISAVCNSEKFSCSFVSCNVTGRQNKNLNSNNIIDANKLTPGFYDRFKGGEGVSIYAGMCGGLMNLIHAMTQRIQEKLF